MPDFPVYLDCHSTTPIDPRVAKVLSEAYEVFGNPHERHHAFGRAAADAVERARAMVAHLLGSYPDRIVFTSGATESCNLAIRGAALAAPGERRRIITLATEHPAVLETVLDLGRSGYDAVILPVEPDGCLDLGQLERTIDNTTLIVSIMAVNNEIGVIQPISDISAICHAQGALYHCDATQAPGRIEVDVDKWGVDMLTISSHKLYGPKGAGALFVADDAALAPIVAGGGQERGFRSGTIPTPIVSGFGVAANIVSDEWREDSARIRSLTSRLQDGLDSLIPAIHNFGSSRHRAAGNLNFGFPGIPGDKVVEMVASDIAISTGSACASSQTSVSHVLAALGCSEDVAGTGVRVGIGRFTTEQDIDTALAAFERTASFLN